MTSSDQIFLRLERKIAHGPNQWRTIGRLGLADVDRVQHAADTLARTLLDVAELRMMVDVPAFKPVAFWTWKEGWRLADSVRRTP